MALRLVLRRKKPDVLIINMQDPAAATQLTNLMQDPAALENVRMVGVQSEPLEDLPSDFTAKFSRVLSDEFTAQQMQAAIMPPDPAEPASALERPAVACSVESKPETETEFVLG